ncbi:hypothetical protein D791_02293 [Nitrincola nitratireducens]|uniref:Uncharacterized protein n=1 Tax=Nitrincola nitratireducens TaxID=1229521 RepID=W9UTX8_9GAMM|nr:hypothetical protein D791_02293 [Nitrincola nitratireducens]
MHVNTIKAKFEHTQGNRLVSCVLAKFFLNIQRASSKSLKIPAFPEYFLKQNSFLTIFFDSLLEKQIFSSMLKQRIQFCNI